MSDLSNKDIINILHDAKQFSSSRKDWHLSKSYLVANLFFEPSTRTHYSFVSAEYGLNCKVVDFNANASSLKKGESLYDTIKTFAMLGYQAMVIRHPEDEYFTQLQNIDVPIINAGDGCGNHPSQCLLDLYTIYENFNTFEDLNVVIVGDVSHSRVARSNDEALTRLGAKVKFAGPKEWMYDKQRHMDLDEAIAWADVVMLLRIQHERHEAEMMQNKMGYLEAFGLTQERYANLKEHAIVMHPAPVNRGVEIDDCLVEASKSRIFKQMENGVYVRKAMLKYVFQEEF